MNSPTLRKRKGSVEDINIINQQNSLSDNLAAVFGNKEHNSDDDDDKENEEYFVLFDDAQKPRLTPAGRIDDVNNPEDANRIRRREEDKSFPEGSQLLFRLAKSTDVSIVIQKIYDLKKNRLTWDELIPLVAFVGLGNSHNDIAGRMLRDNIFLIKSKRIQNCLENSIKKLRTHPTLKYDKDWQKYADLMVAARVNLLLCRKTNIEMVYPKELNFKERLAKEIKKNSFYGYVLKSIILLIVLGGTYFIAYVLTEYMKS